MLVPFALSFIGVIIIFANYKLLRYPKVLAFVSLPVAILAVVGFYLLRTSHPDNPFILMMMMSPFSALVLLEISRLIFKRVMGGQEIILYLGGFLPRRFEERFVSRMEKVITFLITALAILVPYFLVLMLHR